MCGSPGSVDISHCFYDAINAIVVANLVAMSDPDFEMPPIIPIPFPNLELPEVSLERNSPNVQERLSGVEVDVWKCLFDDPDSPNPVPRSLTMAISLDSIRRATGKLRIEQQDSLTPEGTEVRATWQRNSNEDLIKISRRKLMETAASQVSNPDANQRREAEKRMFYKQLGMIYVHEVCHGNPNHSEPDSPRDEGYFLNTNIGQCELNSYREIFGEDPPDYQVVSSPPGTFPDNTLPLPSDTTANEALRCLSEIVFSQAAQSGQGIHHIQYAVELLETAPVGTPIVWGS